MKKLALSVLLMGVAATGVYGQGQLNVDNTGNTDTSSTATSGGLVFLKIGNTVSLENNPISVTIFGGANAGSLAPVVTLLQSAGQILSGASVFGSGGIFSDTSGSFYLVNGIAGGTVGTLEIQAWEGNFSSYAAAVTGGAAVGQTVPFLNGTGGGSPPVAPVDLVGMPALILTPAPEPSTIALGGLGAAALMLFRRRK